jgi:hypothetical protein
MKSKKLSGKKVLIGYARIDRNSGKICTDIENTYIIYPKKKDAKEDYPDLDYITKVKITLLP